MAIVNIPVFDEKDNYVFIPACCYDGNRFDVVSRAYPPMFTPEEAREDMSVTLTILPKLNKDFSGKIEVTSGDAATPCVGVFSKTRQRAILVFTLQEIQGENIGLAYENHTITLTWPARREYIYRAMNTMLKNEQVWTDKPAEIPYKILDFECKSLAEFFRTFFENRRIMGMDDTRPPILPFKEQFEIQRHKFNTLNWHESGFYMIGTDRTHFQVWQPGWCGGSVSGYPLMQLGGEREYARQRQTLDFLFSTQTECGLFHGIVDNDGNIFEDGFTIDGRNKGCEDWHLIRKTADTLYYLFKDFSFIQQREGAVPAAYVAGAKRAADRFVALWQRYGQFGQFVNVYTGELIVGGSTCAAIAPGALAKAYEFYGKKAYIDTAKESAEFFYREFLSKGYTTGGPGEILQAVDSESGAGLLESYVTLYELSNEEKWLRYARECAEYLSSWVMSYNYRFPKDSEFGRLGMKTVGSVFANLQNKHSAPGLCIYSGLSIFKLWKWTGDELYLQLVKDIALTISQYMSTEDRPIYDRKMTAEERQSDDPAVWEKHRLKAGFINERVNTSDWEGENNVGGVFNGSCWCETSNLLALCEVVPALEAENLLP